MGSVIDNALCVTLPTSLNETKIGHKSTNKVILSEHCYVNSLSDMINVINVNQLLLIKCGQFDRGFIMDYAPKVL